MGREITTETLLQQEAWLLADKHNGVRSEAFTVDRERLLRGEPLAYIIGWTPFLNTKVYLDSYPLIPRPETEYWTANAIEDVKTDANDKAVRVLDLCAGSGCIGVAVLSALPSAHVDFVEIEEKHHPNILKNIRINEIDVSRTNVFGGDLFSALPQNGQYDYIFTNPPYIDPALDRAEESVKDFEPHSALYGGERGFELIERIIRELPARLRRAGTCYLEHEPEQEGLIAECAAKHHLVSQTFPDQYGIPRYSKIIHKTVTE